MQYSDNSGLGSELAGESDFEREDLDFTTEEGSDQFSRAETPIESMSRLMSAQDSRPTTNNIKVKETNLTQTKQSKKSQKKKNKTQKKPEKNPSKKTDKKTKMSK